MHVAFIFFIYSLSFLSFFDFFVYLLFGVAGNSCFDYSVLPGGATQNMQLPWTNKNEKLMGDIW
jgi:hypothetical protein